MVTHTGPGTASAGPRLHALFRYGECECGSCTGWMRQRRGSDTHYCMAVTLCEAMQRENRAAWPAMAARHAVWLGELNQAAAACLAPDGGTGGPVSLPAIGLHVLRYAGELAAVLQQGRFRDRLPAGLVAECEQAVIAGTVNAALALSAQGDLYETIGARQLSGFRPAS